MKTYGVNVKFGLEYSKDVLEEAFGHPSKLLGDGVTRVLTLVDLDESLVDVGETIEEMGNSSPQALAEAMLANYSSILASKDIEAQIGAAYLAMDAEIRADMVVVFGTTSAESASAYQETWAMMVASPSSWSSAGLSARFDRGGLSTGDALDTDQKVTDYAQACLDASNAYGIARMQRIEQFRSEREALLSS